MSDFKLSDLDQREVEVWVLDDLGARLLGNSHTEYEIAENNEIYKNELDLFVENVTTSHPPIDKDLEITNQNLYISKSSSVTGDSSGDFQKSNIPLHALSFPTSPEKHSVNTIVVSSLLVVPDNAIVNDADCTDGTYRSGSVPLVSNNESDHVKEEIFDVCNGITDNIRSSSDTSNSIRNCEQATTCSINNTNVKICDKSMLKRNNLHNFIVVNQKQHIPTLSSMYFQFILYI